MENPFELIMNKINELNDKLDYLTSRIDSDDKPQTLSVKEVAKELDVTQLTVRNWIKKGTLKASKIGRKVMINRTDLDNSLKEYKSLKYKREVKNTSRNCIKCSKKLEGYETGYCRNCKRVELLTDEYIINLIKKDSKLENKDITKELINLKKTNILLKRINK